MDDFEKFIHYENKTLRPHLWKHLTKQSKIHSSKLLKKKPELRFKIDLATEPVFLSIWNKDNEIDENIKCDVCLGDEEEDYDKIVICDGCNNGVH